MNNLNELFNRLLIELHQLEFDNAQELMLLNEYEDILEEDIEHALNTEYCVGVKVGLQKAISVVNDIRDLYID